MDLIRESSFAKSTLKIKCNVKCHSKTLCSDKIWVKLTCSDKEQSWCRLHQPLQSCHNAEYSNHTRSGSFECSFAKSHLTGELLFCVSLSPFSSCLVLPSEQCEGIVLHPLLGYDYIDANFSHHCWIIWGVSIFSDPWPFLDIIALFPTLATIFGY